MPIRFQVDPDFYDHPKTIDLSDAAVALWTRAGAYSTHKLLDGFVPDAMLPRLSSSPEETSKELVRSRLWLRVKGGYQFHQWGDRNLTKDEVEATRIYERNRKRKQRHEDNPQVNGHYVPAGHHRDNLRDNLRDIGGTTAGTPSGSVSVSVSESVLGSGHAASGSPEPPRRCPEHQGALNPPPCGACAEQRKTHDAWYTAKTRRIDQAPRCRWHRGQLAHNCAICRAEALGKEPA